ILGPGSPTSPTVNVISATMDFAAVRIDEQAYRAEAKELEQEMSKILKDVDAKTYKAVRIGATNGRIATQEVTDLLTVASPRRPTRGGGENLGVRKPVVCLFERFDMYHYRRKPGSQVSLPFRMYVGNNNKHEYALRQSYCSADEVGTGCKSRT